MAVIPGSLCLDWVGSEGQLDGQGGETYRAVWNLKTDDPLDQAQVVWVWFIANVVNLDDPYDYGNDNQTTKAVARRITPRRVKGLAQAWKVTVDYTQPPAGQLGGAGDPVASPHLWRPEVDISTVQDRRGVRWAKYLGGYDAGKFPVPADTYTYPQASNGQRFSDPPVEEDYTRSVVTLTGYVVPGANGEPAAIDVGALKTLETMINSQPFQWTHRGMTAAYNQFEMRIESVRVTPERWREIDYLRIAWTLAQAPFYHIPLAGPDAVGRTWRPFFLDEGSVVRACLGDPDGRKAGETIAAGDVRPDSPAWRPGRDFDEGTIGDLFPLDGKGLPLDACANSIPIYGQWVHYDSVDFLTEVPYLQALLDTYTPAAAEMAGAGEGPEGYIVEMTPAS